MTKFFSNSLDHLFDGDPREAVEQFIPTHPQRAVPEFKSAVERFSEGCDKCRGSGRFISYSGRDVGECFACKGQGKKTFKTSPDQRLKAREQVVARKARVAADCLEAFARREPDAFAWLEATAPRWELAASLLEGVKKWGSLTEKQMAIVTKGIARDAERTAQRAAKAADAPAVDTAGIDRLKAAFDKAVAFSAEKGLKLSPRITIGGMTISPAKATSANPGALYVKQSGGERVYLGKVAQGRFFASRDCTPADAAKVSEFIADPQEAAKVYGQTTGVCCICNATLKSNWKLKGIGPICAEKFGWA